MIAINSGFMYPRELNRSKVLADLLAFMISKKNPISICGENFWRGSLSKWGGTVIISAIELNLLSFSPVSKVVATGFFVIASSFWSEPSVGDALAIPLLVPEQTSKYQICWQNC